MTLDELKLQVKKDLEVDDETLDKESYKNQELYAKYLDHKTNFELLLYRAKGDYKVLYREKWEYYGGKADAKVYVTKPFDLKVLKSDLSIYIESDEEIIQSEHKVAYLETVVKYIDGVIKSLDVKSEQINIAVKFVETALRHDEVIGINWDMREQLSIVRGGDTDTSRIFDLGYLTVGNKKTVKFLDDLKDLGFQYATKSGISIAISDVLIPDEK